VYYPLSTLMLAGLRDILIISTPDDTPRFQTLFEDGSSLGLNISYAVQPRPEGIAQAFIIGRDFIGDDDSCLILGDNLFHGEGLASLLQSCVADLSGATIFGYHVSNPEAYGVLEFDSAGTVSDIVEKPKSPRSHIAIPGLYFYDNDVCQYAAELEPSARGEVEITDLHRRYLEQGRLTVHILGRGMAWLDTGTHESLHQAGDFIHAVEAREGLLIGSIEEVAFRMGLIDAGQLARLAHPLEQTDYGRMLARIAREGKPGSARAKEQAALTNRPSRA
jgi:glucose-1-phosphate thymidylyltransferase